MSRVQSPAFGVYAGDQQPEKCPLDVDETDVSNIGRRSDRGSEQDSMDTPQMYQFGDDHWERSRAVQ